MTSSSDLDSAAATDYIQADWQRFRTVQRLCNHWERPGWSRGRRSYHWMLTFDSSNRLRTLAARCQTSLRDITTLDLVPLGRLHLTLQRVGFTDGLDHEQIAAIVEAARTECSDIAAFTLMVGPLVGSSGAVRFSAGPHQPVHHIRDTVRRTIATVRGAQAVPARTTPFLPHISIAYNNTDTNARPIVDRVTVLRELAAVPVAVETVDLVEMRRHNRTYTWETVARVPLTSARSSDAGPPEPRPHQ